MAPMERSKSPIFRVQVIPAAIIERMAVCPKRFRTLFDDRNAGRRMLENHDHGEETEQRSILPRKYERPYPG